MNTTDTTSEALAATQVAALNAVMPPPDAASSGDDLEDDPELLRLIDRVRAAAADGTKLAIAGGGSKAFYGEAAAGERFDVTALAGISSYEPTELVVTVRCGTPLDQLEGTLAERGQCLPFEPPHFGTGATVGGMVAVGLAGPARAAVGGVRDYLLGATLLNGRAEVLSFGGQVMKNVAGYDVSRLLAGSLGTLGVILEVSLKVLPQAPAEATLRFEAAEAEALNRLNGWGGKPLPINASVWQDGVLTVRLRGARAAVASAAASLGGERLDAAAASAFWHGMREHGAPWFADARRRVEAGGAALWRLSVPQTAAPLGLPGPALHEWGGAQRWLCSDRPAAELRAAAAAVGGPATPRCFAPPTSRPACSRRWRRRSTASTSG